MKIDITKYSPLFHQIKMLKNHSNLFRCCRNSFLEKVKIFSLLIITVPAVGRCNKLITRTSVLFPAPE